MKELFYLFLLVVATSSAGCSEKLAPVPSIDSCGTIITIDWPSDVPADLKLRAWSKLFDAASEYFVRMNVPIDNTEFRHPDEGVVKLEFDSSCADALKYTKGVANIFDATLSEMNVSDATISISREE